MPTYQCPTCHQTVRVRSREDAPHRPFCSRRCQMIDLDKWFEGDYRVSEPLEPGRDAEDKEHPDRTI